MDEEETKKEEGKPEEGTTDTDAGNTPKASSLIDDANTAAKRLEEANKKQEELINRQEEIYAKQQLAGRAEAGSITEKPKKQTDTEYAESLERGEVNPLKEDGLI